MTETTIFGEGHQPEAPAAPVVPQTPVLPPEVVEFVGEGKKYKSVEDALKSVPHAQNHIQTLEQKLAEVQAELEKRRTAEELLQDIKQGVTQPGNTNPKVDLSQDVVSEIVRNVIHQEKEQEKQNNNIGSVVNSFISAFGDREKAQVEYEKLALENNLSVGQLNNLAAVSPDVVLKLAGIKKSSTAPLGKTEGSINSQALNINPPDNKLSCFVGNTSNSKSVMEAWNNAKQMVLNQQQK